MKAEIKKVYWSDKGDYDYEVVINSSITRRFNTAQEALDNCLSVGITEIRWNI